MCTDFVLDGETDYALCKKKKILVVSHAPTPRMHVCTLQGNTMQIGNAHLLHAWRALFQQRLCAVSVNIPLTAPGLWQHKEQRRQQNFDAGINNSIKAEGPRQNTHQCGNTHATIADWKAWGCSTCPWHTAICKAWLISQHKLHPKRAELMEYHQSAGKDLSESPGAVPDRDPNTGNSQ